MIQQSASAWCSKAALRKYVAEPLPRTDVLTVLLYSIWTVRSYLKMKNCNNRLKKGRKCETVVTAAGRQKLHLTTKIRREALTIP